MQHVRGKTVMQDFGGGRVWRKERASMAMRRWEYNIKWMFNKDDGRAWIGLIWLDRDKRRNFVHTVMKFRIPRAEIFDYLKND
jgi:hypothetical protein